MQVFHMSSQPLVFLLAVKASTFGVWSVSIARGQCDVRFKGWVEQNVIQNAWATGRLALDVAQTFGTAVKLVLLALNNLSASQGAAFTEINGFGPNFSECVSSWLIKCEDST